MKIALLTLAIAFLSVLPLSAFAMENENNDVKAVTFYADSCGACKILKPKWEEAITKIDQDKITFVKFDFSNKDTIAATRTLAQEQNVNDVLQHFGAKTGFVVLVNKEGEITDTVNASDTTEEIAAKLSKAIANAG